MTTEGPRVSGALSIVNVPGRVIEFSRGGEAWSAYSAELHRGEPRNEAEYDAGEWGFFEACELATRRYAKGGWWVRVALDPEAVDAARYWAETLATSSGDDASWDDDARADLRAARRLLERLA